MPIRIALLPWTFGLLSLALLAVIAQPAPRKSARIYQFPRRSA